MKLTRRGELFAEFALGRYIVTALSDGYADVPFSNLLGENSCDRPGAPSADSTIRLQVNAFLIFSGKQHLLIDAGSANAWQATVGRLYDALDEARVPRAKIGAVALTHSHVDHVNGLVTPVGAIAFTKPASILIHSNEVELVRAEKRLAPALQS
ncbi:MAG: MBL fold metallo-hydrolase, partial [Alphaproteobacteria bacterium]|nr:MBL fold metallo-hydrolase [Alphaproteobacteria bacterium]